MESVSTIIGIAIYFVIHMIMVVAYYRIEDLKKERKQKSNEIK